MANSIETSVQIKNSPKAVMDYIADVRHRPLFLPSLKSVSNVKEKGGCVGTTWKWTWVSLGMEFSGVGRCLEYEEGKRYAFKTEGGIESTWTYSAEKKGDGTRLSIRVDYTVPESAQSKLPGKAKADKMKQAEADQVVQNLKLILDE